MRMGRTGGGEGRPTRCTGVILVGIENLSGRSGLTGTASLVLIIALMLASAICTESTPSAAARRRLFSASAIIKLFSISILEIRTSEERVLFIVSKLSSAKMYHLHHRGWGDGTMPR